MTDNENYVAETPSGGSRSPSGFGSGMNAGGLTMTPSIGILSYWQGVVEIGLRLGSLFFVFLIFLTSAIAVGEINAMSSTAKQFIDDSDYHHDVDSRVPDTHDLVSLSRADGGFLIFFTFVVVFYEFLVMAVRFINVSIVNQHILIFHVIDIAVCGVFALIYLITGAFAGSYSSKWDEWKKFTDDYGDDYGISSSDKNHGVRATGALGAACAFCIFEVLVLSAIGAWMLVCIIFKWYLPTRSGYVRAAEN